MNKNTKTPLVSVLMPVYNGEKYLNEVIESVLNQTYTSFEFIIINDGSTDKTEDIILSYSDERICYVKNEENIRLISSLNKGIDLVKGKYIFRIDADDVCLPKRFELQLDFMENNPDVGLLGTYYESFNDITGESNKVKMPFLSHPGLRLRLLFSSTIRHPSACIRTSVVKKNNLIFKKEYLHAEEHKFWVEIMKFSKVAVIPEILIKVRVHDESVTANLEAKKIQAEIETKIRKEQLELLGINLSSDETKLISQFLEFFRSTRNQFLERKTHYSKHELKQLFNLIRLISNKNRENKIWDIIILESMFWGKYSDILLSHSHIGIQSFSLLNKVNKFRKVDLILRLKNLFKSIFYKRINIFPSFRSNKYLLDEI